MSSRPPAMPSTFPANGSWCDQFPPLASNVPFQPLVSYPQATGHGSSAASHTTNTGAFSLLQQHTPPMNTLSDCNFGIYGFHNQPNSTYPQPSLSPISSDHNQVGMLFGYPLSSTGNQTSPMPFPIFRQHNIAGIPLAAGGLSYGSTIHHSNNTSPSIVNQPFPVMIANPSAPQQNPILQPYPNQPVMNVGMACSLRPPNVITAKESSPFRDAGLFTGQLPEPYREFSTDSVLPVSPNITSSGQRYENPPCNNFSLDGAAGKKNSC